MSGVVAPEKNYREQLRQELQLRQKNNPHYSLRSFARDLKISHSFLSKVLKGNKTFSLEKAVQAGSLLGYNKHELEQFCRLVQLNNSHSVDVKKVLAAGTSDTDEVSIHAAMLNLDSFHAISDWYHLAILDLTYLRDFNPDPIWIADRLGISKEAVRIALSRLLRLGLLKAENGTYVKTNAFLATPSDLSSEAIKNYHSQMIDKAKDAMFDQDVSLRDITSVSIPIDLNKIQLAKEEIKKFRRKMAKLLDSGKPTSVYQMNIQFFSLTREKLTKEKKRSLNHV